MAVTAWRACRLGMDVPRARNAGEFNDALLERRITTSNGDFSIDIDLRGSLMSSFPLQHSE